MPIPFGTIEDPEKQKKIAAEMNKDYQDAMNAKQQRKEADR